MPTDVFKAVGDSVSITDAGDRHGSGLAEWDRFDLSARRGDEMKSAWASAEEKREAKLELIREQVESGSLVIRKMTKEERRRCPHRPASPKRPGWR
ncbi:MAG: hypothetical protein ACTHMY_20390 [Solirubrobacteraceae bacterium]